MSNICKGICGSAMEIGGGRIYSGNSGQLSLSCDVISCGRGIESEVRDTG